MDLTWREAFSNGRLPSDLPTEPGLRSLSPVQWNRDGCQGFAVRACDDVPAFDEGMIRRALLRGSLGCDSLESLGRSINRELWAIGYVARVRSDPASRSVVVEVFSAPH
jgi:hypothetical protein